MLKSLSQFWLILSLLLAPLQFIAAESGAIEMGPLCCVNMDGNGSSEHDACDNGVECSTQCKMDCTAGVLSMVLPDVGISVNDFNDSYASKLITSLDSLLSQTELRPPKSLHS